MGQGNRGVGHRLQQGPGQDAARHGWHCQSDIARRDDLRQPVVTSVGRPRDDVSRQHEEDRDRERTVDQQVCRRVQDGQVRCAHRRRQRWMNQTKIVIEDDDERRDAPQAVERMYAFPVRDHTGRHYGRVGLVARHRNRSTLQVSELPRRTPAPLFMTGTPPGPVRSRCACQKRSGSMQIVPGERPLVLIEGQARGVISAWLRDGF